MRFGISIYPEVTKDIKREKEYLKLAIENGAYRLFINLLDAKDEISRDILEVIKYAKHLGFMTIADVNPEVLKKLNIKPNELYKLKNLGLSGIRLDNIYNGIIEREMTYNEDFKIELNMSARSEYLDFILMNRPNMKNLIACHNFYPRPYTGLSKEHFLKMSKKYKKFGIHTAAFVSIDGGFGPWPIKKNLPTLEEHRFKSLRSQIKELKATSLIDDVIISNCYATKKDFDIINEVLNEENMTFDLKLLTKINNYEKEILFNRVHNYRADVSEYQIRSTLFRNDFDKSVFKSKNNIDIACGHVTIDSCDYPHYSGELQIALKEMKNSGNVNVLAKIIDEDLCLLEYIKPMMNFEFKLERENI
ncbi:MAG: MupG family TIM beta-alpha barrel fold protein [Tissierellia bacterium]|nr:MupG family TIM beta-alpha barrel fold protein [Tissierellia bacterium]